MAFEETCIETLVEMTIEAWILNFGPAQADPEAQIKALGGSGHDGAGIIVLFDELEKALGGAAQSHGDSGVRSGLFGSWLSWMSDPARRGSCFVLAAMNDPASLPDETFRPGRFDAGFYFELPDTTVRTEIARIHFQRRLARTGRDLSELRMRPNDWGLVGVLTDGYLPAEIERLVVELMRDTFLAHGAGVLPDSATIMRAIERRNAMLTGHSEMNSARAKRKQRIDALLANCLAKGAEPAAGVSKALITPAASEKKRLGPSRRPAFGTN